MKKLVIIMTLVLLAAAAWCSDRSIIDREDLSLKAGPTEPGEAVSLVWLESYVYPKSVKEQRVISLGVRATAKVAGVTAAFDFAKDVATLSSNDGLYWSGAYKIPNNVPAGLHIVRYEIYGRHGSIKRTIEFFIEESLALNENNSDVAKGEAVYGRSWPLTVKATCPALVGASTRILYAGQELIGVSKVPWYKVILADGEEGWVAASQVKEPLEEYYMLGYEAYRNKKYSAAIEYYQNTVSIKSDFVKGHFWLAKSYFAQGDLDSAYRSVKEALRLDERNIDCHLLAAKLATKYFDLARAKFSAGRYNEAVVMYQKVLDLKPTSALSWIELAESYAKLGLPLEARSAYRQALSIEPQNREILALLNIETSSSDQPAAAARPKTNIDFSVRAMIKPSDELPAGIADDSLVIVRESKTKKGTTIGAALKSVVALTKSLGTPVVEKGWQAEKQGGQLLVRYLCEQGEGVIESFEWLVDVDTKRVSASNNNSKLLMNRW
ncbi:MAG: tetratricopeptide repeat protein [Candidatus Margulisbacteria bacterium]|nr:tetratricopeptide repeat protein [Candidatus Margulisiibacteriota bacterium]